MQSICSLCGAENETAAHLFFKCKFALLIWNKLLSWQGIRRSAKGLEEEVTWTLVLQFANGKSSRDDI